MKSLKLWYRLSLAYFALLLLFVAWFSAASLFAWLTPHEEGLVGTLSLIGFLVVGLFLAAVLARKAHQSQPVWVFVLLYTSFAFLTGIGAWALLAYLTYSAHKKIKQGNSHGL